jgi:hypothetical protein
VVACYWIALCSSNQAFLLTHVHIKLYIKAQCRSKIYVTIFGCVTIDGYGLDTGFIDHLYIYHSGLHFTDH